MPSKASVMMMSLSIGLIFILALLFLTSVLLPGPVAHAATTMIRVTPTGATSGLCGDTWGDPCDLQYALNSLAISDTEIWVAAGLYKPTSVSTNISATFELTNGVALYGGFAMSETLRDQRNWVTHVTVLSGDIDNNDRTDPHGVVTTTTGITGTNAYHVVTASGTDLTAILDGFTITAGNSNGISLTNTDRGGGLFSNGGSPTIRHMIFSGNAAVWGGGLYNFYGNPILASITFAGNSASPSSGGGLYNHLSNPTMTDIIFSGNSADDAGGGMVNNSSSPTLTNVTLLGNSALLGGGMFNVSSSSPALTNVTFSGNLSGFSGGGGMYNLDSSPVLTNVTFISNTTIGGVGGGVANENSSPVLTNVTFQGNSADRGGGIDSSSVSSTTVTTTVRNTILWGNTATTASQLNNGGGSSLIISDSVVQGGYLSGTNIITTNPLLGPFANYGGGTLTLPLLPGSSAIGTGNDAVCPTSDQRGVSRPQGAHCDIGAFESRGFALTITGGNNQSTLVNTPFVSPLSLAVTSPFSEPVDGGQINFASPASGASAILTGSPAAISGGTASVTGVANGIAGSYAVMASAAGVATPINFSLTNYKILSAINSSPTTLGQSTTFTATTIISNVVYTWSFGDSSLTSMGNPVVHTYSIAGNYIATVTATNNLTTVVATTPVTITNLAPIAVAGPNQTVRVNALVTLNGSGSYDPDGHLPLTYRWTQTGPTMVVLSNQTISMPTFTAPSTSSVLTFTLVVTDARGLASTPGQTVINVVPYRVYIPLIRKNM